jgi:hypothetical protein
VVGSAASFFCTDFSWNEVEELEQPWKVKKSIEINVSGQTFLRWIDFGKVLPCESGLFLVCIDFMNIPL